MSIYLTQKMPTIIRHLASLCGQLLLLLALLGQLPAHAAIEDAASISAALSGDNVDNAELSSSLAAINNSSTFSRSFLVEFLITDVLLSALWELYGS